MSSRFAANPRRSPVLHDQRVNFPRAFHARLPDYAPTPLLDLPDVAAELGLGRLWVKDESRRFQMHGYELLGTAWALYREVLGRLMRRVRWDTIDELVDKIAPVGALRVVVVSDNELGVAAARAGRLLGFEVVAYAPAEMAAGRLDALEREGATVRAVPGGYDAALAAAATETGDDTVVLSDTSWPDFAEIPQWITDGYVTVFEEAVDGIEQRGAAAPDAVVVPLGTGALAAAAGEHLRVERFGADLWLLGVEPLGAPCFVDSVLAGRRVATPDPAPSIMDGLARGLPSPLAFDRVIESFDAFVAIEDDAASAAVARLAGAGVSVSASGAAAFAGLADVCRRIGAGDDAVPLGPDRSVLVIATEAPR